MNLKLTPVVDELRYLYIFLSTSITDDKVRVSYAQGIPLKQFSPENRYLVLSLVNDKKIYSAHGSYL